jgi:hypothetical protein
MRRKLGLLLAFTGISVLPASNGQDAKNPFTGRWDLTIKTDTETYPSWIQFVDTSEGLRVRLVGRVAGVHPAEDVQQDGSKISFTSSEWFGKTMKVIWELATNGDKLSGTQKREDGVTGQISGVPAPALKRTIPAVWSDPEPLFDGKDLSGWIPDAPSKNHWKVEEGALVNEAPGANIRTKRRFTDFKLHLEYNCPKDGNSGVYLRGRYEVQIEYEPAAENDKYHEMGSVYGFIAPAVAVTPRPGQWETYDITLVGRRVSILRDGELIIDRQKIPGITGGALDSHEGEPGPIYLQGDHTGGMKYRNITISVPKE